MRLLIRSMLRHLKQHLLQTCLTLVVTILITGMLSVLFHFASSFQNSLRTYALEENGTYHYRYYTNAGTRVAKLFTEMEKRFQEDSWFSDVELAEDGSEVHLILTVANPGFFTSKTMEQKFGAIVETCYVRRPGEVFYYGIDHNYELLASYGDLSKENGIFSFLLVFLVLLAMVAGAAILTLGAVFRVSAMQREREIALLAGIGADRSQIIGMILMESVMYCLVSIPAGFWMGILVYQGIQERIDNIIYSMFRFPAADLVISVPYSLALTGCAVCVILLSGLRSAERVSRISPMEALSRTREIQVRDKEVNKKVSSHKKSGLYKSFASHGNFVSSGKKACDNVVAARIELWLAKKSHRRFKRRNRSILIMLAVTFTLCFVLDGFTRYATEAVKMVFDTISYNFSVDLYGDEKEDVNKLASALADSSGNQLVVSKEAIFSLHSPYPFSEFGESTLHISSGMMPDVSLQCIDEENFHEICIALGISEDADGLWGIFLDTERSYWSNDVKVKGHPYTMAAGGQIRFYGAPDDWEEGQIRLHGAPNDWEEGQIRLHGVPDSWEEEQELQELILTIAGVYDKCPLYMEVTESARMQVLVSDTVFSILEEKRPYIDLDPGTCHISLRGNIEEGKAFGKIVEEQAGKVPGVTCRISDFEEQIRQEKSGVDSFEFLCEALIGIFVFICICGNFTVVWATNRAREREFATLLSIGMKPGDLQKMRLFELLYHVLYAFLPGVLAGGCAYQMIYLIYTSEYQVTWRFPLAGLLFGTAALVISVGATDLALRLGGRKKSLSEQLRMEE